MSEIVVILEQLELTIQFYGITMAVCLFWIAVK